MPTDLWYHRGDPARPTKRHGRGKRWRVSVPGHPTEHYDGKKAAEAREKQLWGTPARGLPSEVTVGELLDLYWASKAGLSEGGRSAVKSGVDHARQRWGDAFATDVERHEVEAWLGSLTYQRRRRVAGSKPARFELVTYPASRTLREKACQALSGALAIAVRREVVPRNEAAGISLAKVERRDPRFLNLDELDRLAAEAGAHWEPMVRFLATTGPRVGEACSRNVGDVRKVAEGKWRVRITGTKGRKARDVPIPTAVVKLLDLQRPASAPLFTYPTTGERVKPAPFRNRVLQPAARRAGLEGLHVHDLRHTAASLMIAGGADVKKVQEALGHKSATMTLDLYGHLWNSGLDEVAARVDRMLARHAKKAAKAGREKR